MIHKLKGLENLQMCIFLLKISYFPIKSSRVVYQVQFFYMDFAEFLFLVSRDFPLHCIMSLKAFFQKVSCL